MVFKLGEDLITDSMQALIELVKNCYDADATWAEVLINTGIAETDNSANPSIVIRDNGTGMSVEQIRRGWLTISNSMKREMKAQGLTTHRGRTPLGDKGLGRLGAQRLGDVVSIITRPVDAGVEHELSIDWRAFQSRSSLQEVDLTLVTRPTQEPAGTTLTITQLREPEQWRAASSNGSEDGASVLQKDLSVLISPYGGERGLRILVKVDEERIDLYDLPSRIRKAAEVRYVLKYADGKLDIVGEASLSYWAPQEDRPEEGKRSEFSSLLEGDSGAAFVEWLQTHRAKHMQAFGCRAADAPYVLRAHRTIALSELDNIAKQQPENGEPTIADPGPFRGEVDYVTHGQGHSEAFSSRREFRNYLRSLAGIRVYRDGFGVRMDEDWLGLRKSQTSGSSFYGLRPMNTLGFIDISARHNAQLVETTDREGFADTAHYRNFLALLQGWHSFTDKFQAFIRRSYNDYRQERKAVEAGIDPAASSEVLIQHVEDTRVRTIVTAKKRLAALREDAEATAKSHERVANELDGNQRSLFADAVDPAITHELSNLQAANKRRGQSFAEIEEMLDALDSERAVLQLLREQSDRLREQLSQTWETVSLGLTAEAVSHEVAHVAEGIAVRSAQIRRHLTDSSTVDRRLSNYIQYVQSSASALKRQLAHLNPSLRYMRERRERIALGDFCQDIAEYHRDRWSKGPISINIEVDRDFTVEVNRGKLTQVLDNLLLNSEYWLLQDHRLGLQSSPEVSLLVRAPYLFTSDNGRGIDRSVESTLFEPFVSFKKRGEGRGLGLYVVTQLLDSEGCGIDLAHERNDNGRFYMFQVDLGGMRVDA
ncbi:ATP-binding protein [Streptomyces sp. NPDC101178]|uniref:ATP-binding protein n=1 Tax=Streptomyces sp. NPDC101178 TaxID=3366124 RepID=UPI003805B6B3